MIINTGATLKAQPSDRLLDGAIASFLEQLQTAGYAKESVRNKRTVVRTFADWLGRRHIAVAAIDEVQVAAFLKRKPGTLPGRLTYKHAALSGFVKYLRRAGRLNAPAPRAASPGDDLITEYVTYLRHDRGLAPNSVLVYVPFIRHWVHDQITRTGGVSIDAFDAATVQRFLLAHTRSRSREYARLLATALRSFFRFLFLRGHRSTDLSRAVPAFLSLEQVAQVLAATDRSTQAGRRDYAILLLPLSTRLQAILAMRQHDPDGQPFPSTAFVFGDAIGGARGGDQDGLAPRVRSREDSRSALSRSATGGRLAVDGSRRAPRDDSAVAGTHEHRADVNVPVDDDGRRA